MNKKSCLIVIDVQKGIFKLKQPVYNENALMQTLAKAIAFARANKIKIIFTQHENNSFLKRESVQWQIADGLDVKMMI